jgi:hypothetical protein
VQPAAPLTKFSRGAPRIVQADRFFNDDSHAFNNANKAEVHAGRGSAQFSAKRNSKNARTFAASSLLRSSASLLSLGNVVEQSTMQLSPFLTDNLS